MLIEVSFKYNMNHVNLIFYIWRSLGQYHFRIRMMFNQHLIRQKIFDEIYFYFKEKIENHRKLVESFQSFEGAIYIYIFNCDSFPNILSSLTFVKYLNPYL
jgi:hypothetical protein